MGNLSIHSFAMEVTGQRNYRVVQKACEMRLEELQQLAQKDKQDCNFKFEVIEGMDTVRVNLYGGNTKDAVMIGYNICMLQTNPMWL